MQTYDRVPIKNEAKRLLAQYRGPCVTMALLVAVANAILTAVSVGFLAVLLDGVITVTAAWFFLRYWRETPCAVSEAVSETFDNGFLRKMGGMLWMQLKVFLWSLLFIIPGIIKSLSYALTPYILAEYPDVPAMEACALSERMMRGHRSELFLTYLSFLGWGLLSACTFGVVYVLYAGPYMQLTYAGIYEEVKHIALDQGVVQLSELEGRTGI